MAIELDIDETHYSENGLEVAAYSIQLYGGSGGIIAVDFEAVNNTDRKVRPPLSSDMRLVHDGLKWEPVYQLCTYNAAAENCTYDIDTGPYDVDASMISPDAYVDGIISFEVSRGVTPEDVVFLWIPASAEQETVSWSL
jgi:hypothetical protein